MMADEMLKNSRTTNGNSGDHPDNSGDGDSVQNGQPPEKEVDEALVWKNKYIQLLADLQNTKKRLSRSAAQEVEADKKALLLDVLPVADGLDLALAHMSSEYDSRNILQGIELIRNILDTCPTKNGRCCH
jgi:molecular chaperone GrpE